MLIFVSFLTHSKSFADDGISVESDIKPTEQLVDIKLLAAAVTPNPQNAQGGGDVWTTDGAMVPSGAIGDDVINKKPQSGSILFYEVRSGDTLSEIAEMFDVTSNTILWANDLASAKDIHPGDELLILPIVGVQHIVKSGDTISSIAKKYDSDADEIRDFNNISDSDLTVGVAIMVPGGNMHSAIPTKAASSYAATSNQTATSFIKPVLGAVRTQGLHGYNAVDFGVPVGTNVRAAAAGEVIVSKSGAWNGGYGNYIVIKHSNGVQTLYAHLSVNYVGVGQYVEVGESIGASGSTGRSTGPHLHFEVRGGRNPF